MESLPRYLELTIIRSWLKGKSRDEIAIEFGKSQGTISNIISTFRNSMTKYDIDSMRDLAKELRSTALTVDNCAVGFRTYNIITKLKIPENEIEKFLTRTFEFAQKLGVDQNMMREILIESANMSIQMPISEIPIYFHKQLEEIQHLHKKKEELEEEIQSLNKQKQVMEEKLKNSRKISNATEETLQDFMHVKKELEFHGISMQDPAKFVICVVGIKKLCNYNPFEVVEKFSNIKDLEDGLKYTQLRKNDLEIKIIMLKKAELDYEDRLNLNFIKLKNLEELENIGFSIRDLKQLKKALTELSMEHKLDFEQVKNQWFDHLNNYESKLSLGIENKHLLNQIIYHKKIIQKQRDITCSQILIGPFMKKLLSYGITELDILKIKSLVDILLITKDADINNQNELQTVAKDLSIYSNLRSAIKLMSEKLMEILYIILQNRFIFTPIQKNKLSKFNPINDSKNFG